MFLTPPLDSLLEFFGLRRQPRTNIKFDRLRRRLYVEELERRDNPASVISQTGGFVLAFEQNAITGPVASFTTNDPGAEADDFTATILWADGASSAGTISANGDAFDISASHTYVHQGSYAAAVRILNTTDSAFAVAPIYSVVLPVVDRASVQSILSGSATSSVDGGYLATYDSGAYAIDGNATYGYTFDVSLIDGLYSTVNATYTASIEFSFSMAGDASPTTFTLGNYTLNESGSVDIDRTITTSDLADTSTRLETGTLTLDDWTKTGNDAAETYIVSANSSTSLTVTDDGIYGGLSYSRDEDWTIDVDLDEDGDFGEDIYTMTRTITSSGTSTETGSIYSITYESESEPGGSAAIVEVGAYSTGEYGVIITGSADASPSGSFTNGVASGTMNSAGDPLAFYLEKNGNWNSGAYTLSQTITAENVAASGEYTDQTASGDNAWTGDATVTTDWSGNVFTGAYLLHVVTSIDGGGGSNGANQDLTAGASFTGEFDATLDQTGNVLSGEYTLELETDWSTEWSASASNQGALVISEGAAWGSSDLNQYGNSTSGAYTISFTASSASDSHVEGSHQDATFSSDASTESDTVIDETGNTLTGAYSRTFTLGVFVSTVDESENQTDTYSGVSTLDTDMVGEETGNTIAGTFTLSQTTEWSGASSGAGIDARGDFTTESASGGSSHLDQTGDAISGDSTLNTESESTITVLTWGGNGDTTYEQTVTTETNSSFDGEANAITGEYASYSSSFTTITFEETGDYLDVPFSTDTADSTLDMSGNSVTGDFELTATLDTTSDLYATGADGDNSYEHWKTAYANIAWSSEGNDITGAYTTSGTNEHGSTADEENTYADGEASFTEVLFESFSFTETGNSVTGDYSRDETAGIRTSTLDATPENSTGTYTVDQWTDGTFTRSDASNRVIGNYLRIDEATDEYETVETGSGDHNFTLTMSGTNSYTDTDEGNTVTGAYTRSKIGTDSWTMEETGTMTGGSYSQSIFGEEAYTLTDEGNLSTGHFTRTIEGNGTYDRTTTGAGATLPTDSGIYAYLSEQTTDPQSGVFDLTQTGTARYALLEDFYDISNTNAAQAPGHMNVYPFGQAFVDPPPGRTWRQWGEIVWAGAEGAFDGQTMVWNATLNGLTLGNSPLETHVNGLVATNGGGYGVANVSANVGVLAAETAVGTVALRRAASATASSARTMARLRELARLRSERDEARTALRTCNDATRRQLLQSQLEGAEALVAQMERLLGIIP